MKGGRPSDPWPRLKVTVKHYSILGNAPGVIQMNPDSQISYKYTPKLWLQKTFIFLFSTHQFSENYMLGQMNGRPIKRFSLSCCRHTPSVGTASAQSSSPNECHHLDPSLCLNWGFPNQATTGSIFSKSSGQALKENDTQQWRTKYKLGKKTLTWLKAAFDRIMRIYKNTTWGTFQPPTTRPQKQTGKDTSCKF